MAILISGIGRSGTTTMYQVIGKGMIGQFKNAKCVYEPYLWNIPEVESTAVVKGQPFDVGQVEQERDVQSQLDGIVSIGLNDDALRESQFVIAGYVNSAKLDPELAERNSLDDLRNQAGRVEEQFLGDAGRKIDGIIDDLAKTNSRFFTRMWYELLFGSYLLFVLFRKRLKPKVSDAVEFEVSGRIWRDALNLFERFSPERDELEAIGWAKAEKPERKFVRIEQVRRSDGKRL